MRITLLIVTVGLFISSTVSAMDYQIDPDHSTVGFKIKHLAISKVPGRFTQFSGTFSFDPTKMEASKADAKIVVQSINTENKKRDDHLRNPDFFDATKFPEMTFKSTKIVPLSAETFSAVGDLTMHGVTKPVTLNIEFGGLATDPWGNERAAFTATTKINRKDFGLVWNKTLETGSLLVGEDVEITLEVEGIKSKV